MRRLIVFILICSIFLVFIVFNLENKSDISFGFMTFEEIPVFVIVFSAFLFGMLFAVPFAVSFGKNRKNPAQPVNSPPSFTGIKKPWGKKSKNNPPEADLVRDPLGTDEIKKQTGSYGID